MARIKARERSAWQDDPNWKPLAPYEYKHNLTVEPKGVERHRLRMADHNFVRQPSIEKAEQAANSCLLMGLHLPVDPMQLLIRLPRVQLFTYRDAAIYMDMTFSEFEGKYGMKDGFTVRLKDKRGDVYWAVAFRPDVSDYRLRFTLAHELGHIMMDHIGTLHADEIEADFFASCLLAPRVVMEDLPADDVLAKRCGITKRQAFQARCRRAHTMPPLLQYHLRRWYAFELRRQAHRAEVLERRKEIEFRIRRDRQRYVSGEVARWRLQAEQAGLPQEEIDRYALEATKWGMEHIVRAPIREDAFKDVQGWKVKKARFVCVPAPRPRNAKQARVLRRLKAAEEDVFPARDIRPMEPINDGSDWEPFGVEDFVALVRRYDKYMEYSEHLPQKRPRGKKKPADAMEETQKNAAPADAAEGPQAQENQGPADITGAEKGESPEKT